MIYFISLAQEKIKGIGCNKIHYKLKHVVNQLSGQKSLLTNVFAVKSSQYLQSVNLFWQTWFVYHFHGGVWQPFYTIWYNIICTIVEYFVGLKNRKRIIYSTINPKEMGGGAKWPAAFEKVNISGTKFPIHLKTGCKFNPFRYGGPLKPPLNKNNYCT